jgi:D-alanyl-D-alanine carboxypeptidase
MVRNDTEFSVEASLWIKKGDFMHQSTIVFALLSLGLAVGIASVAWYLIVAPTPSTEEVEGHFALGIPDLRPVNQEQVVPAGSAIVWNTEKGAIVFEQNAFERRPIASLTKLMTAMVALDYGFDLGHATEIKTEEYIIGGKLLLHPGESVTMRDLFSASLLGSANNATLAYVRELGVAKEEFIRAMNRKAVELELEQTFFTDVTGLDDGNIATAYEVARLAEYAWQHYPLIADATAQPAYSFIVGGSGREHTIHNTNKLVADGSLSGSSKTGYLYEAGYCLVFQDNQNTADLIAVVLGSPSEEVQYQGLTTLLTRFGQ